MRHQGSLGFACYTPKHPLGWAVAAGRAGLRWTQKDLAKRSGVGLSTLQTFEDGDQIRLKNASKIVSALLDGGVRIELGEEHNMRFWRVCLPQKEVTA